MNRSNGTGAAGSVQRVGNMTKTKGCKMNVIRMLVVLAVLAPGVAHAQDIGWAPGVSVFANPVGPRETEAIVDANGIVQTTAISSSAVLPAVETHAFYHCGAFQCGPFAAITLGEGIVAQVHGGIMVGLKGFNIGVGYSLKPNGQVLRGDFVPGRPAPGGATATESVTRSITGISVVLAMPLPGS